MSFSPRENFISHITKLFNEEELKELCFVLYVDYDSLPAVGKRNKARELFYEMQRTGRLADLINLLNKERPSVNWPKVSQLMAPIYLDYSQNRPVPGLLPYLVNRSTQDEALEEALLHHLSTGIRRPLICLVYGDEQQCHEKYLERVLDLFPEKLEAYYPHKQIKEYPLLWPERLHDLSSLHTQLQKNLSRAIIGNREGSLAAMNNALGLIPIPTLIHTTLLSEDWDNHGQESINQFILFWRMWPELSFGQLLIVILFIKYRIPQRQSILQRLRLKRPASVQINDFLERMSNMNFEQRQCTILPRLENITRREIENWATRKELDRFRRQRDLFMDLRQIFEQSQLNTFPMEIIARELHLVLESYIDA